MADYQLTNTASVIRTSDGMIIPNDMRNADRMKYQVWLDEGGVPDPHVPLPVPVVPADANARIDAGVMAALTAAQSVRDTLHAIPSNLSAANFQQFLLQAKILSDAFVAMLQAQATPPPE